MEGYNFYMISLDRCQERRNAKSVLPEPPECGDAGYANVPSFKMSEKKRPR